MDSKSIKRKQRTRAHQLASLSEAHVRMIGIRAGMTFSRVEEDYGIDLLGWTFDVNNAIEPGIICIQLKARERIAWVNGECLLDLAVKDLNTWTQELNPFYVILYCAATDQAYGVNIRQLINAQKLDSFQNQKTVRIAIPQTQRIDVQFFHEAQAYKNRIVAQANRSIQYE